MRHIAEQLVSTVDTAAEDLTKMPSDLVRYKASAEVWSVQELIGHLMDSAVNNHHRFIRAQEKAPLRFPKYEQNEWVMAQNYNASPWLELVTLWKLYNHHLARVITHIPQEKLKVLCHIGAYEPVTLEYLIVDYLEHLQHHLRQIRERIDSAF